MKKILQEPLLHFLILGSLIYLGSFLFGNQSHQQKELIVSAGQITHLKTLFRKTWQREPNNNELQGIIQEYILQQAAYNEGVRLGLDKNDIVIVRRVHQKLNFIAEEYTQRPVITDKILQNYLNNHPDKFSIEPIFTLRQIYFDQQKKATQLNNIITPIITHLHQQPNQNISQIGDRYLFKTLYKNQSLSQLKNLFGQSFAQKMLSLSTGQWSDPIQSSFGTHLVYIEKKQMNQRPPLETVRDQVIREWENDLRKTSTKNYYKNLLKKYHVTIDWPSSKQTLPSKSSEK